MQLPNFFNNNAPNQPSKMFQLLVDMALGGFDFCSAKFRKSYFLITTCNVWEYHLFNFIMVTIRSIDNPLIIFSKFINKIFVLASCWHKKCNIRLETLTQIGFALLIFPFHLLCPCVLLYACSQPVLVVKSLLIGRLRVGRPSRSSSSSWSSRATLPEEEVESFRSRVRTTASDVQPTDLGAVFIGFGRDGDDSFTGSF